MLMNFTQTKKKCHPYTRNKKASEIFAFSCYNMQMKMKFSFRVLLTSIWIESHLIYLRSLWLQNPALLQLSIKEPMPNHIKEPHTIVFYFLRMITKNDLWAMRTYVHIFSGVIAHSLPWLVIHIQASMLFAIAIYSCKHPCIHHIQVQKESPTINQQLHARSHWTPNSLASLFDQPSMDPTLQSTNCNFFNQLSCMDQYWLHGHDHCMGSCALPSP